MHRFTSSIRRPVKREGAEQYLLVTLLSFAASVSLTRLFLELTGYPQLGGGTLHIAHVLWGGLLLFLSGLLPLMFANRWVYTAGSVLAGAGVGLFIDEVGKFITASNDYFYPLAAPIIYAFFLMTVILYLRIRRPPSRSPRAELYRAFDAMEEVLEHDLDEHERAELEARLKAIAHQQENLVLAKVASSLLDVLHFDLIELAPHQPTLVARIRAWWARIEQRYVSQRVYKAIMAGGVLGLGIMALVNMFLALPFGSDPTSLERILENLIVNGQIASQSGINWFAARLALETSVGLMLLIAAGMIIAERDRWGTSLGYMGLLLSLTTVDLLVFYFDQFSAILTASLQFTMLMAIAYYRRRYLPRPIEPPPALENESG